MISVRLVVVLGVLLAASVIANGTQLWWAMHAKETIGECKAQTEQRDAQLERQNSGVADLEAEGKAAAQRAATAEAKASDTRQAADSEASRLLMTDVPADCEGAVNWAAETGAQLGASWEK